MNDDSSAGREWQLRFLEGLVAGNATVAGDVLEVGDRAWAIYGSIPVDGEVIMAEFGDRGEAEWVLSQVTLRYAVSTAEQDERQSPENPTSPDQIDVRE